MNKKKGECEFRNQFLPIVRSQSWSNCKHRMKIWWWWNAYFSQAFRTWWFLLLIAYYRDRLIYWVSLFQNFHILSIWKKWIFPPRTEDLAAYFYHRETDLWLKSNWINYNFVGKKKKNGLTRSGKSAKIRFSAEMCKRKFIHTYGIKLLLTFLLRAYVPFLPQNMFYG